MLFLLLACTGEPCEKPTLFLDGDGDGVGAEPACAGVATGGDCDDADPTISPGTAESCDGRDEDCDGDIDEDVPEPPAWHADADADGYGDPDILAYACTAPDGALADGSDCDDTDPLVHPDADELCNLVDDDCDALIDDSPVDAPGWYLDGDGDGFGDPATELRSCDPVDGRIPDGSDCDDGIRNIHPGADETCNGLDDDCDGAIDEDAVDAVYAYTDNDADGYGIDGTEVLTCEPGDAATAGGDCDDADPTLNSGAPEACDGIDNNCDGAIDEPTEAAPAWYWDNDGDGYGADPPERSCSPVPGKVDNGDDCNDLNPDIHPGAEDDRGDSTDEDCDGYRACYGDADGDGVTGDSTTLSKDSDCRDKGEGTSADDCDDADPTIYPDATEIPYDGIDQDCDGADLWDADGDGWDADAGDCDDTDADVSPDGTEVCDGADVDEDCDGLADDLDPELAGGRAWYPDVDGDGFGDDAGVVYSACLPPGAVPFGGDCDDTDATIHPLADEDCDDPVDRNCDGSVGADDLDGDGLVACEDCDDSAALSDEVPDGIDNDCDGLIDEYVGDLALTTAAEIDSFCASYQSVEGELRVASVDSLTSLWCLRAVSGRLRMDGVAATDFSGLEILDSVGGNFLIGGWQEDDWPLTPSAFRSFDGLDRLRTIGGDLRLDENEISSLDGLPRLETIGGSLSLTDVPFIEVAPSLPTLGGDLWIQEIPDLATVSTAGIGELGGSVWIQESATSSGGFTLDIPSPILGSLGLVSLPAGANLGWSLPDTVGALYVQSTDLVDLDGLEALRTVEGDLVVQSNPDLVNIHGLDGVTTVGGDLSLISNTSLPDCGGFPALTSIGGWLRLDGKGPTTLVGFGALTSLGTGLELKSTTLTTVTGFESLTTTPTLSINGGSKLYDADALAHLRFTQDVLIYGSGLDDLGVLAGTGAISGTLEVSSNGALTSLAGAEGITAVGAAVTLEGDNVLAELDGLAGLAQIGGALTISDMDALTGVELPALRSVGGDIALSRLDVLADVDGLGALEEAGGLWINDCHALTGVGGLGRLQTLDGSLILESNGLLTTLDGLGSLVSIGGDLRFSGTQLVDLAGLDALGSVGGTVTLSSNRSLIQPAGLGALRTIGGDLWVEGNVALLDLDGMGVETIGGALYFYSNRALVGLDGLDAVTDVGGNLVIADEDLLTTLAPLGRLAHVGGDVRIGYNALLPDLVGLDSLTTVDGDFEIGRITGWSTEFGRHDDLVTMDGVDALTTVGGDFRVCDNPVLADIDALDALATVGGDFEVCDNVSLPTAFVDALVWGDLVVGGDTRISGNL